MRSEALEKALAPYAAFEDGKRLRAGFTTGTTAAAAALAAATLLFSGERLEAVSIRTPVGAVLPIPIESLELVTEDGAVSAVAAVRKDAGDDPDVTDGLLFYARVGTEESAGTAAAEDTEIPVVFRAGPGIGTVTKPGLDQPVGEAAINRVPRNMIAAAVRSAYRESGLKSLPDTARIVVTLSCPEGEEKAKKTFNPKLGIQGGLSILGTEGIVRPMSRRALIETIVTDVKFHLSARPYFLAVPGSYGLHFLEGGIMNTHSREADCRLELFAIHAFQVGAPKELVTAVLQAGLTTEAVRLLKESGFLKATSESLLAAMERAVAVRTRGETEVGILFYTLEDGVLAESENARRLMERSTET